MVKVLLKSYINSVKYILIIALFIIVIIFLVLLVKSPKIEIDKIITKVDWYYLIDNGEIISESLKLNPDGEIIGSGDTNDVFWKFISNILIFYDSNFITNKIFWIDKIGKNENKFSGKSFVDKYYKYILYEKINNIDIKKIIYGRKWIFKRGDNSIIANEIYLSSRGKIKGYYHPNEDHWGIISNKLVFYNKNNIPTTIFNIVYKEDDYYILKGKFLLNQNITHILKERKKIKIIMEEVVLTRKWEFGRGDGVVFARNITLSPDGRIIGYYHPNEAFWDIEDNILVFYNKDGKASTRFTFVEKKNGKYILSGYFLFGKDTLHILKEM